MNTSEDKISLNRTIFLFVLGISTPTTDFPSITSTTLTLLTARERAISWEIFVILLALVPGAGWTSNLVTTGPGNTDTTSASTPNSNNFFSSKSAKEFNSSLESDCPSSNALSNKDVFGIDVSASLCFF